MRVRQPAAVACLALAAVLAGCSEQKEPTRIAVGTRNLYLGTPIELAIQPPAGMTLYQAIDYLWSITVATDFPARAGALADEIAAHKPALVGLQEVALWRTQCDPTLPPCGDGPWNPAEFVVYDFLAELLAALQARGLTYAAVASVVNFDGEFTGASGNDYRYTDRDVIIALQGVQTANARGGNFAHNLTVIVGGFPITITRGWVSVDAAVDGKPFRFASAHLDDQDPVSQGEQAREFLDKVSTTLPLVAVGDFNSNPTLSEYRPAYGILTAPATGLMDVWAHLRPADQGFSCCRDAALGPPDPPPYFQTPISDPASLLYERIDLVLHSSQFMPEWIDLTAGNGAAIPASGLWQSDHGGVFSGLELD